MGGFLVHAVRHRAPSLVRAAASVALALGLSLSALGQSVSVTSGQAIFGSRCGACHSLDAHRVGPALGNVLGRVAGKASEFSYSQALSAARHVWDRDSLLAWLTDPESVLPGQAMGYRLEQAQDRRDVVAYLASLATR